jgi:hypothetical protein
MAAGPSRRRPRSGFPPVGQRVPGPRCPWGLPAARDARETSAMVLALSFGDIRGSKDAGQEEGRT